MSFILNIDPEWLVERIIVGKTAEEVGDEIAEMLDGAMRREGERMLAEMRKMLEAKP